MEKIQEQILNRVIQKRPEESYKGMFGKVLVVGGCANMGGAAIMAGSAAVHSGAGLVTIASAKENLTAIHAALPEAMYINFLDKVQLTQAIIKQANVIVVGPGLGTTFHAIEIFKVVLNNISANQDLIIDGSAITLLSMHAELMTILPNANLFFTPHEMEWQRLSKIAIPDQTPENNQQKQQELNATVILKKHHTEIYFKNGMCKKLMIGTPAMATGGMGDTLTGILAGFLAQFKNQSVENVIQAAVYTHSKIADDLAAEKYVVLPTDIINTLQVFMHHYM